MVDFKSSPTTPLPGHLLSPFSPTLILTMSSTPYSKLGPWRFPHSSPECSTSKLVVASCFSLLLTLPHGLHAVHLLITGATAVMLIVSWALLRARVDRWLWGAPSVAHVANLVRGLPMVSWYSCQVYWDTVAYAVLQCIRRRRHGDIREELARRPEPSFRVQGGVVRAVADSSCGHAAMAARSPLHPSHCGAYARLGVSPGRGDPAASNADEAWVDFVADTGDGFNSTCVGTPRPPPHPPHFGPPLDVSSDPSLPAAPQIRRGPPPGRARAAG